MRVSDDQDYLIRLLSHLVFTLRGARNVLCNSVSKTGIGDKRIYGLSIAMKRVTEL